MGFGFLTSKITFTLKKHRFLYEKAKSPKLIIIFAKTCKIPEAYNFFGFLHLNHVN